MEGITQTFENKLVADPIENSQSRQVAEAHFSYVDPEFSDHPKLVHASPEMKSELGLGHLTDEAFLQLVAGNVRLEEQRPYAMAYGGHQFGQWAGQLGDGRAINIGELKGATQSWALQLKGSGRTPYSRTADGYAVLRSSIREYLCSEAMFHLGVPTTRALSLVETNRQVLRDVLYNGNPAYEKGAVVCRVSPSFIRFGSFELFASRSDTDNLKKLVVFSAAKLNLNLSFETKEDYLTFFEHILHSTLDMVLQWQRVGFVHGVMNTDNLSVHGITIDYGPYGWLEGYDPNWTPNTTDAQNSRYRYGNQAGVAFWNLVRLANALFPLIEEVEGLQAVLAKYEPTFQVKYDEMMKAKLGINETNGTDGLLISDLTELLERSEVDMTLFFRRLSAFQLGKEAEQIKLIRNDSYANEEVFMPFEEQWEEWLMRYGNRLGANTISPQERIELMHSSNPKYVLRNYMAQLAIDAADKDDYALVDELFILIKSPYAEQPEMEKWFAKRPSWADHKIGCSMLSCSS